MFRKPRDSTAHGDIDPRVLPYVGRAPTPPPGPDPAFKGSPYFTMPIKHAMKQAALAKSKTATKAPPPPKTPNAKQGGFRQNKSILNFFEKSDTAKDSTADAKADAPLFYRDSKQSVQDFGLEEERTRFNEDENPVKRRRTVNDDDDADDDNLAHFIRTPSPKRHDSSANAQPGRNPQSFKTADAHQGHKYKAGFLDDSSDEEDEAWLAAMRGDPAPKTNVADAEVLNKTWVSTDDIDISIGNTTSRAISTLPEPEQHGQHHDPTSESNIQDRRESAEVPAPNVPTLIREATSVFEPGEFGDEDFENDEFYAGGEEYMERMWMEEQREMEEGLEDELEDSKSESGTESVRTPRSHFVEDDIVHIQSDANDSISVCPICNGSMKGLAEAQASAHVNACLDGTAEPLPKEQPDELMLGKFQNDSTSNNGFLPPSASTKRFQRAAIARPAQSNPFSTGKDSSNKGSAFAKLMSGHAEDAAWAEAATNEVRSRGKPAYQRTCPFYKIMPGLYICVDAFRYGKVEGQNAYFLSHFHSDHYIGLTSSWCHGPIYASKVTCNLMLQQLRVDPKWVVPLEFEKKVEVPNTRGVFVTMIPANHCPGSSLYLFEKVTGKNRDGSPKSTRILHCGDFRACPAHVTHPLLRPDVLDSVTGQTKQQVIDTCYLDTTYLTPKYAFPSQYDVIDACAQMCVSLAKEIVDTGDNWERVKADRAGSAMKKFLEQGEATLVKAEDDEANAKPKLRGRLLVVIGTYSIGKERICLGIAKALDSKIYAPPGKMRICKCLEDEELNARLTKNPLEAQVHMQTLMEIRAETLHDYMMTYKGHFARVVGFRPTGWNYRPPTSRFTENPAVGTVLHSEGWKTRYTMRDLAPQRGSTRESNCFGVPYSEHSSFRELTMFCCALRINRIVPTVNVGSARSREKMKAWIEKWDAEKRKNGLFQVEAGAEGWGSGDGQLRYSI